MGFARTSSKTPWGAIVSLVAALLYGASPIDVIPDFIPLIGFLDDGIVVTVLVGVAWLLWRRRLKQRKERPRRAALR